MQPANDQHATTALRGPALTFSGDPFVHGIEATRRYEPDAIVAMSGGTISHFGPAAGILRDLPPGTPVEALGAGTLLIAGCVDCHVHYPQLPIIGAGGYPLIEWLERYTFVAEQRFADAAYAREIARVFLAECLRAGTTTAAVFCTVHPQSVDAFFAEAQALGMRMIAGKVLMDRNAPAALTDTAQRGYDESKALIARWHGRDRLRYAITPRFAASSTPEQLELAGALWREHPGTHLQSHVAENRDEVAWVARLFPDRRGYLDVYDHYGLLGTGAIYGHGIWLDGPEWQRCHDTGTAIAHCPTSNLFLGSGLFDLTAAKDAARPVRVGLASDLGAGTTFSLLRTMGEAAKVAQLGGHALPASHAFYLATRGGAQALGLDDRIGSIAVGMEADLVALDLNSTPLIAGRMAGCRDLDEALAVQMTLADERAVLRTYVAGRLAYSRSEQGFAGERVATRLSSRS